MNKERNVIGKNHRLGILGGGQLGRMFIQEAINYNVHVHIMESDESAPCFPICHSFTKGDITNYDEVLAFGSDKDVVTVEIENVNIDALYELEKQGVNVYPQPRVLEIIKDKGTQKTFYAENNIPTSDFRLIEADQDSNDFVSEIPFVQKLRQGGYDGRGVSVISNKEKLSEFFREPSIIEKFVPFSKELSVIVARNENGETAVYPTVECEFNDANLVEFLFSPAEVSGEIENKAEALAVEVINKIDMVGILAVEMFLLEDDTLLVNEIAPRPHNSGHHTIECNITSQFEQHLRAILNLSLGSTEMIQYGAMLNVLGEEGYQGNAIYSGLDELVATKGVHLHLYGKELTKPNRKMGHITITAESIEKAKSNAQNIKGKLRVIA